MRNLRLMDKTKFGSDWRGTLQSRCLAETTGGRYVAVHSLTDLIAALRDTLRCRYSTENIDSPAIASHWLQVAGLFCRGLVTTTKTFRTQFQCPLQIISN